MTRLNGTASMRLAGIRQHLITGSRGSVSHAPLSRTTHTTTTAAAATAATDHDTNMTSGTTQHDDDSSSSPDPSSPPKKKKHTPSSVWTDPKNYGYWLSIQSRWSDNDVYGHMNKFRGILYLRFLVSLGGWKEETELMKGGGWIWAVRSTTRCSTRL